MQKVFLTLFVISIWGFPSLGLFAAQPQLSEMQALKLRQKEERGVLKNQERYTKQAFRGQSVPKALRIQKKHELQREKRALLQRQKDQRQELKDRQSLTKESLRRHY